MIRLNCRTHPMSRRLTQEDLVEKSNDYELVATRDKKLSLNGRNKKLKHDGGQCAYYDTG